MAFGGKLWVGASIAVRVSKKRNLVVIMKAVVNHAKVSATKSIERKKELMQECVRLDREEVLIATLVGQLKKILKRDIAPHAIENGTTNGDWIREERKNTLMACARCAEAKSPILVGHIVVNAIMPNLPNGSEKIPFLLMKRHLDTKYDKSHGMQ